ncbi:hypothetical protein L6452_35597 [Arctium lappa]|uniref:Uncharacterized protein n=1 Tax=Arctium lappa TaxID=4217 RepID=A0ACB8Y7P5_ARCLA|nr:hypothetical protein L6452_35597 [Arctium lappa]
MGTLAEQESLNYVKRMIYRLVFGYVVSWWCTPWRRKDEEHGGHVGIRRREKLRDGEEESGDAGGGRVRDVAGLGEEKG